MNIVVYCSSCEGLSQEYEEIAQAAGRWIGENGHSLVFGGVKAGLMHTVAQATHDAGGKVYGVVPASFAHRIDPVCDEIVNCKDLIDRKQIMIDRGDAFICLPGGIGTIDEWITTLSQLIVAGKEEDKPIFAVNYNNMYGGIIEQLSQCANSLFARGKNIDCSVIVNDKSELIEQLNQKLSVK